MPEAHTALALIVENYDYDWQTAERELRRAIDLNPSYATAHQWYAEHLAFRGRFDEAFVEIERAHQLDPLSLIILTDRGALLYYSRQYDRAINQFSEVLEMDPSFTHARMIAEVYLKKGMSSEAMSQVEFYPRSSPWYWATVSRIQAQAQQKRAARQSLEQLLRLDQRDRVDPAVLALGYIGTEQKDKAIQKLQEAYTQRSAMMPRLAVDPAFDVLRNDARFDQLLRKTGVDASFSLAHEPVIRH